jgi:nitrogen fixation protein NifQ
MNTAEETLMNLEQKVTNFLQSYASTNYAREHIASLVAEKSLLPNHMYQDLLMDSRVQMGEFMAFHFGVLATMKPKDVLWKKFIYDCIGEVAPACSTCSDNIHCFSCKS